MSDDALEPRLTASDRRVLRLIAEHRPSKWRRLHVLDGNDEAPVMAQEGLL